MWGFRSVGTPYLAATLLVLAVAATFGVYELKASQTQLLTTVTTPAIFRATLPVNETRVFFRPQNNSIFPVWRPNL
jgi:hypothetical protein